MGQDDRGSIIRRVADRLFSATDTVCLERAWLVTEAYAEYEGLPAPLLRARAFEHLLSHVSIDVESNPVIAGNTSSAPRAWMLVPEFGLGIDRQIELEHPALEGFLDGTIPEEIEGFWRKRSFGGNAGIGHLSVDFDLVVNRGLGAVLSDLEAAEDGGRGEEGVYRAAMAASCRAVIGWAHRIADAAEHAATKADGPALAAAHRRVAAACRWVPERPARDLFEGLQAMALVHSAIVLEGQGLSVSIGLPDRVLARFASQLRRADDDWDEAVCHASAFLLRVASNSYHGRGSKTQAITVGGRYAGNGADASNSVTELFLEAFDRTPVNDPHLFVRRHRTLSDAVWHRAMEMLAWGRSMPMIVNDDAVIPGLIDAGVSEPDASDYCIVGCNELGIPGRACQSGFSLHTGFNDLELIDQSLRALVARINGMDADGMDADGMDADVGHRAVTAQAVLREYESRVSRTIDEGVQKRRARIEQHVRRRPFPFTTACCTGCAAVGQDLLVGMRYPEIYGVFIRGTTNAVNVLSAVEYSSDRSADRLAALLSSIDADSFDGLDAACRAVPRWGIDDPRADCLGVALGEARDRAVKAVAAKHGLPPFTVCHVVRSLHHLDGLRIGSTLDGRRAGEPVADSVGPAAGAGTSAPTAALNSVLKLNAARWFSGLYNLNVTLPAGTTPETVSALLSTFLRRGGQEIQVNVLDPAKLKQAQANPEGFRDVVVRVAGLNARFVELGRREQDELIRRAQATIP